MEQNKNDRGNSSDQRKKLSYAKEHMKGKKFRVVRPENRSKYLESDDTAINAVIGTLTGGHHDVFHRHDEYNNCSDERLSGAGADTEKVRQMQKAMFIRQQLMQEEHYCTYSINESVENVGIISEQPIKQEYSDISDVYQGYADDSSCGYGGYEEPVSEHYSDSQGNSTLQPDKEPRRTDAERSVIESGITHTVDPETIDRYRKAQFIRESLMRESKAAAYVAYDAEVFDDTTHDPPHDTHKSDENEYLNSSHEYSSDGAELTNSIGFSLSAAPIITNEIKQDIIRGIKSAHFKDRLEERRRAQADEKHEEQPAPQPYSTTKYRDAGYESSDRQEDITAPIETAASYISNVQSGNAQSMVTKPVADIMKHHMGESAAVADSIKQTASAVASSDSMQAVPFNIGMILAENEGKKLAYKIAKGEDILAEKEQVHVKERMAQSKYRFVEPEKHTPKVEKRETIQQEQKRRFIKSTENKKAEVRREAEHKAKENIYLKANRKEEGLLGKIFGEDKKYHPKSNGAVIAGAAAAVIPVILIIIVVMFICALFSWASPHKEKLFDDSTMSYQEKELSGEEVIEGYVEVVQDIFDEKQLDILAKIAMMDCDHDMLDNRWIKLDENFDIESIIAIEAAKKWREIQDSQSETESEEPAEEPSEEEAEDFIYHLTREDFEEVIELTFNFDARAEVRVCDQCAGEQQIEYDPDTGEFYITTIPCVHRFLMGAGVNNLVSIAGHDGGEYYFFDKIFDKDSETYEEDKMMYDLYREVLQKNILGTTDEPSHTIVDYSGYSADYQRMMRVANAHGYTVTGDKVTKTEE